ARTKPTEPTPTRTDLPKPLPIPAVQARDFAKLTMDEARDLAGKRERFSVLLDGPEWVEGDVQAVECASADDASRTVWLPSSRLILDRRIVVEGEVRVIDHKEKDGFPGFTEL